jgi:hypothetical protein
MDYRKKIFKYGIFKKFKQNEKDKKDKSLLITVSQNNRLLKSNKIYRNYELDAKY